MSFVQKKLLVWRMLISHSRFLYNFIKKNNVHFIDFVNSYKTLHATQQIFDKINK